MRHVFIVNPAAGKNGGAGAAPRIHAAFAGAEEGAYAIRVTRGAGMPPPSPGRSAPGRGRCACTPAAETAP